MPSSRRKSKNTKNSNANANTNDNNQNTKVDHSKSSAVFRIKPLGKDSASIKYKGFVTETQRLGDEIVELETPLHPEANVVGKHAIPIDRIDDYEMLGRIYRSNIIDSYIVLHNNYPVIYLTIEYAKSIATGSLLQIYLSLKMDKEQKKEITKFGKLQRYVNLQYTGTWNLTMECDPELKELWREKLEEKLRDEYLEEFHIDYETNEEKQQMDPQDILVLINDRVQKEIEWYASIMEETPYNFKNMRNARQYFIDLAQDPRFLKLLKVAMYCRILNRRNESNIEDDIYEIPDPDKVVKMDDVRKKMIEDDELIVSDSESEQSTSQEVN